MTPSRRRLILWAIVYLPAAALLGLLLYFAVDVPYWDDWGAQGQTYGRVLKQGHLTFAQLFAQSLESRPAFPRLVFVAIGMTIGWHVKVIAILNWLCGLLSFVALAALIRARQARPELAWSSLVLIACLLFSPIQWINWMWAIQFMQFIPPLVLAVCLWIQASSPRHPGTKVLVCALLAIVATFSPPSGMATWVLAFPFLLLPFGSWRTMAVRERAWVSTWAGAYVALAVLTIGFYFWDYRQAPDTTLVLASPLRAFAFFCGWVGAPLVAGLPEMPVRDATLAFWVGLGLLAAFAAAVMLVVADWRRGACATLRAAWPWVCLAGFGIATGLATAFGRAVSGNSVTPRYLTHALWVTIGLVGLLFVLCSTEPQRPGRRRFFASVSVALALPIAVSWVDGVQKMRGYSAYARQNLLTLRLIDVAPANPLFRRLSEGDGYPPLARLLIESGILEIEPIGGWVHEKLLHPDDGDGGRFRMFGENERDYRVTGWAVLPGTGKPPDCVLIARPTGPGTLEVVSGLTTELEPPDAAKARAGAAACPRGFDSMGLDIPVGGQSFDLTTVAPRVYEEAQLMVFAVDLAGRRVYRLAREDAASFVVAYSFLARFGQAEISEEDRQRINGKTILSIDGERRLGLLQNPDSEIVFRDLFIQPGARLVFGVGIDETAWDKDGDGATFEVSVVEAGSERTTVFTRWLDPKNEPSDRRWFDEDIDLAMFAGKSVDIRFRTTEGPAGDGRFDWAGWSDPRVVHRLGGEHKSQPGVADLRFTEDILRLTHPMVAAALPPLHGRLWDGRIVDLSRHPHVRYASSDPEVIEVLPDRRLRAHRFGAVEVTAMLGDRVGRMAVRADWPAVIPYGQGVPGKGGVVPLLEAVGGEFTRGNGKFRLRVSQAVGGAKGIVVAVEQVSPESISTEPLTRPPPGVAFEMVAVGPPGEVGAGVVEVPVLIPENPPYRGEIQYLRAFFVDDEAENGWSSTNGMIMTVK